MFDQLKSLVSQIFSSGSKALDSISNKQQYQADPRQVNAIQSRFEQYATAKPADYITEGANKVKQEYTYDPSRLAFKAPFQQEMRQLPNEQDPMIQRLNNTIAAGMDWTKRIGNGVLDWTIRPIITRPAATAVLSVADLLQKGDLPSFTAKDPAGRLLMGDQPLTSYQQQGRNATNWLEDKGMPKGGAVPLGIAAGVTSAALDAPSGGIIKTAGKEVVEKAIVNNLDDAVEVAWKSLSAKDRLKRLLTYKDELVKSGFALSDVEKMSAKQANVILKNGVSPKAWADNLVQEANNTSLWKSFDEKFKDWIGGRQSAKFNGIVKSDNFKRLDALGTDALNLIEGGEHRQALTAVRQYFDDAYARLQKSGISINYVSDYLPHMWKESASEAEIAMGRRLSKTTPFSLPRIIKDYQDGLAANLHPRYEKLSDLIGAYESSISKTLADKSFYDWLRTNKLIMTASEINKLPKDKKSLFSNWVSINADRFGVTSGTDLAFKADPDMAGAIDNYLMDYGSNPSTKFGLFEKALKAGASLNTSLKNWYLQGGIPKTAVNSFGLMSIRRHMYAGNNPIKNLMEGVKWVINPSSADEIINSATKELPDAVKNGLVLSIEDHDFFAKPAQEFKNVLHKAYGVTASKLDQWFSQPTFQHVLPAMKIKTYRQNIEIFLKQGLPESEAKKLSASVTNDIYGGLNLELMNRDKGLQVLLKNVFLAPDLYESQARVAGGMAKSIFKRGTPEAKAYAIYTRNVVMDYLWRNVVNKTLSGHYMWENPTGDKLNIDTGTYQADGTHRFIKGYGMDAFKVPFDLIDAMSHGDAGAANRVVRNRLSATLGTAYGLATNTTYSGSPIVYPDASPAEKAIGYGAEASKILLPPQVAESAKLATGQQGGEQTLSRIMELPIRYSQGPRTKAERENSQLMQTGGLSGEQINTQLEETRPWNQPKKLTEEQQIKNLKDGLSINTERGWFGKPKTSAQTPSEASYTTETIDSASMLRNGLKADKAQAEKKTIVKKIYENLETDEQVSKALKANGISEREAMSLMALDLGIESGERGTFVKSLLDDATSKDEFVTIAAELIKDGILTTGVTKAWLDRGEISEARKREFDNLINTVKGKKNTGSGTGSKSLPANTKMVAPKFSTPTMRLPPKVGTSAISKPFTGAKIREIGRLPSFEEMQQAINSTKRSGVKAQFSALPQAPK